MRLRWDVDGREPTCAPTELRIEPDVGFLSSDRGEVRVASGGPWTLMALNPAGTNRQTVAAVP